MRRGPNSRILLLAGLMACWVMMCMPARAGGEDRPVSGVLAAASGPVSVRLMADQAAAPSRLTIGSKVFFGDEIITGDGVRAQILLRDGTTFSIGEGANLVLDEFVYDPASGDGGIGVVIKKGAFRFVSGKIAKKTPQNMQVLAGSTSIAVRGTEVIGTVGGGGGDSVILISGQVDLVSIAGECVAGGSGDSGDMFSISPEGALQFKADIVASPPAYCNRSLLRGGFGVQVAAGGQLSAPGRVDPDQIDSVIDAVTIRSQTSQEEPQGEEEAAPEETLEEVQEEANSDGGTQTATTTQTEAGAEDDIKDETGTEAVSEPVAEGESETANLQLSAEAELVPVTGSAAAPVSEAKQDGLSEFDKVVMRAFGMMEDSPADQQTEEAVMSGEVLQLATARRDAAGDEEKDAARDSEDNAEANSERDAEKDEGRAAATDAEEDGRGREDSLEEEVKEDVLTEQEKRNENRIGEATRELTDTSGGSGGGNDGGSSQTNSAPVLAAIAGISFTDTSAQDSFNSVTGTLSASDSDSGDTLTYAITGGSASNILNGYDLALAGSYGMLFLNSGTGAYSYEPNENAMEAAATNVSDSFTMSVSDGTASASQILTASIAGTDDGPSSLDMMNLSNVGGQQNVGATGLRFGIVTDPEGDTVTDQTSTLNALPAWLSFGSQVLGDGSVQYFWEVGANEAPWRAGTKAMNLKARSSAIDTAATSFSITFACQSDHCNDFLQSTDTESSPNVDDPTNIGSIRTGIKLGTEDFFILTEAERDALFDPSVAANGTFRVIYSGAETGTGSPAGSWDIDQTVNVDYKSRAITVNGTVSANSIGYFDGGSDSFTYQNSMAYTDTELSTYSVFGKTATTNANTTYQLKNTNGDTVHVDIHDQVGFMRDANSVNAALINTNITPSAGNPFGYKDDTNQLIQQRWRLLEPQ